MTNMKKILALGAAVALVSCARFASAQDDLDALLNDLESDTPAAENAAAKPAEEASPTEEPAPVEEPVSEPAASAAEEPAAEPKTADAEMDELLDNIVTTETNRRLQRDLQARREIDAARACMKEEEYLDAERHYSTAEKLLGDSPANKNRRKECVQGSGEAFLRAAKQERALGQNELAFEIGRASCRERV